MNNINIVLREIHRAREENHYAMLSNLLRHYLLARKGGFYFDTDIIPKKSIQEDQKFGSYHLNLELKYDSPDYFCPTDLLYSSGPDSGEANDILSYMCGLFNTTQFALEQQQVAEEYQRRYN